MGDKQSRAAAASGDTSAASKESEAAADAPPQEVPTPGEEPKEEGAAGGHGSPGDSSDLAPEDTSQDAVPSESEILARLVATLGQCPGRTLALAEIREHLPPSLRRLAEDTDSICKWLCGFPGLFEVSGAPGAELITLTVGKLPRPAGSAEAPHPAAAGTSVNNTASSIEAVGNDAKEALAMDGTVGPADEEVLNPSTVQLRGLPFRASVGDVKAFLGEHAKNLVTAEPAIRLLLNRDGRPSGFARVQFTSPQAAQACREALHRRQMGDRYIEVLACSDRAGKARQRRAAENGPVEGGLPAAGGDSASEYLERERVLQECQEHMRMPGRNQLLLSMLGIALSQPARAYLRRANLGLKHFLARFPNEFRVEGPKGCERVIWCGAGVAGLLPGPDVACAVAMGGPPLDFTGGWPVPTPAREPSTPTLDPPSQKGQSHSGHCVRTPSDWGTPGPAPLQQTMPEAGAAPAMDFSAFAGGSWGPGYAWPPPWAMAGQPWMQQWPVDAGAGADAGFPKVARADQAAGRQAAAAAAAAAPGKRGARGEASASRSHAHLHPQSHPFANRAGGGPGGGGALAAGQGAPPSAEPDGGKGAAVPALRLRGLPFNVTVQDVLAFFAQHEVADRIADGPQAAQLLPKANGRPSGQAVVQMRSRYDAEIAQKALYHQFIGGRYIEVFVYGDEGDSQGDAVGGPARDGAGSGEAAAEWHAGLASAQWQMPPWAGAVPPPVPGGAAGVALGGQDGEAREGEAWGAIFNWLWHSHDQVPGMNIATAVTGASGPGAVGPSGAPAAHDAPARATLQV